MPSRMPRTAAEGAGGRLSRAPPFQGEGFAPRRASPPPKNRPTRSGGFCVRENREGGFRAALGEANFRAGAAPRGKISRAGAEYSGARRFSIAAVFGGAFAAPRFCAASRLSRSRLGPTTPSLRLPACRCSRGSCRGRHRRPSCGRAFRRRRGTSRSSADRRRKSRSRGSPRRRRK